MVLWHEGAYRGDSRSGLVHSASVTPANVHDSRELPNRLHGNETRLYGDSAYAGRKEALKAAAAKAKDFTNKRAGRNQPLTDALMKIRFCPAQGLSVTMRPA